MATIRNKFHELGNWHNKMSMVTIVTGEALENINLDTMSKEDLAAVLKKVKKDMQDCAGYIEGADNASVILKDFVYKELGKDSEILEQKEMWHCYLTRVFRFMVLMLTWPFRQIRRLIKDLHKPKGGYIA